MDEKLSIRINIGDKYYPLRIERNEEEVIRKAAKIINDKLSQYRSKYSKRDMVDLLAMTALQYTKKYIEYEVNDDQANFDEELKQLNIELEDYINQNK